MFIRGIGRIKKIWHILQPHVLVLAYHRVCKVETDPQMLCVSPQHFEEQLQVLQQRFHVISLQELVSFLSKDRDIPHRTVVLTFDDGYADNLYHAKPLLEQYDTAATIFVSGGNIDRKQELWWDALERIFLLPGKLPSRLTLTIHERSFSWDLQEAQHYTVHEFQQHRGWNALMAIRPTIRHQLYETLHQLVRPLSSKERESIMQTLLTWAEVPHEGRKSHRILQRDQVKQVASGHLIEIGAHCMTHPVLSMIPEAEQSTEIVESKRCLERILGRSIDSFAYPFGARSDYTRQTIKCVQQAGFACACSNFPGVVVKSTDRFQFPRVLIRDWSREQFSACLDQWFL